MQDGCWLRLHTSEENYAAWDSVRSKWKWFLVACPIESGNGRQSAGFFPEDLAQWMAVQGEDPSELLQATGRDAALFRRGVVALGFIEDDRAALTAFDGMTGPLKDHWARIAEHGIAPTPLERYASCPSGTFQPTCFDWIRSEYLLLMSRTPVCSAPCATRLCDAVMNCCFRQDGRRNRSLTTPSTGASRRRLNRRPRTGNPSPNRTLSPLGTGEEPDHRCRDSRC